MHRPLIIFLAGLFWALNAQAVEKRFDCVTLCCHCTEEHFCEDQFDHLNNHTPGGHYLAMGTDSHWAKIRGNGNALAAYYDTLTENWKKLTAPAKAEIIHQTVLKNFPGVKPHPAWLILNEISAGNWPEDAAYRRWVIQVLATLKVKYGYSVIICVPFTHPAAHNAEWQAVAANAYIGIECYLSGKVIVDHTNSVTWCEQEYRAARNAFIKRGVPLERLFLVEHFAQTGPDKNWGRQGVSLTDWAKALQCRSQAAHQAAFSGFVSYAWGRDAMQASENEMIQFEDIYARQKWP